jgi:cytochrome c553
MRRNFPLLLGAAFVALTVAACEGPTGPQGPAGSDGTDGTPGQQGPAGPQGPAGADAMNTCVQCHGHDTQLLGVEWQFVASPHYDNVYWYRTGSCMECHNHQGFITRFVNGEPLPNEFDNPSPINCRTCHNIHTTFTDADYSLTTLEPVDLYVGATANLGGAGNLCSNCHQARPISPMPVLGGGQVTVTNFRWGPHYGTQGNVTAGTGAFHFPGNPIIGGPNTHGQIGCQFCHMALPVANGNEAGGHTFSLRYGQNGENEFIQACHACHEQGVSNFHVNTRSFNDRDNQAIVQGLLDELADMLKAEGIMREDGYAVPGTYDADVAAAYLNHRIFYYDGSRGVHNPQYTQGVLYNTVEAMRARQ